MQVHPNQISPGESFDIFYFLRNHTDSTTYYVRGVVYDVRTGEVLSTTNLDQAATNSRLFIKTVQAPPDPSGYGRNIVAIATVYTDSCYTTKSESYEEQEQYFLVKAAPLQLGGGGVDMRALRESIEDALDKRFAKLPKPEKQKLPKEVPSDAILGAIGKLQETVNRIPKELVSLAPVQEAVAGVRKAVESLPEPEKLDLSPVLDRLESVETLLESGLEDVQAKVEEGQERFLELQEENAVTFADRLAESSQKAIQDAAKNVDLHITLPMSGTTKSGRREAEAEPFDISSLVS